jgi:sigma-B regulation protein RsbU (phosphoserine phosphatase)
MARFRFWTSVMAVLRLLWERFSIGLKLPLLFLVILLASALYSFWFSYKSMKESLENDIDDRLRLCVEAVDAILPDDFHDRALTKDAIPPAEIKAIWERISRIAKEGRLSYLYALARVGDGMRVTASSKVPYFTYYDPAEWPDLSATLADGETRIDEGSDSYGMSRSIVVRRFSLGGRPYCIGADMPIPEIENLERRWFWQTAVTGALAFIMAGISGYLMAVLVTRPLRRLSDFTESIRRGGFASGAALDRSLLPASKHPSDEVCLLARNFSSLREELDAHLRRLAETVAAKERTESDMRIAGKIQQGLLPAAAPVSPRFEIQGEMTPARSAGGDLFDYFPMDAGRLCFAVGDVSGKGMPAAMFMASTLTLFRAYADAEPKNCEPGEFLARVMRRVDAGLAKHNDADMFVTMLAVLLDLDAGEAEILSCGHNPPLLVRPDGSNRFIDLPPGGLLGVDMEMRLEPIRVKLVPGDTLLLYTDGVTEALSPAGVFFGVKRLMAVAAEKPGCGPGELVLAVRDAVFAFSGGADLLADDVTLLALRWLG